MRNSSYCGVGGTLSADIAVPDHARELSFYATVLTTGQAPLWRDDLSNNHGTPIIGLGARTPDLDALPLQWMPHIQVSDVAASAARAVELGGRELMHGRGNDGESQWAVLIDPLGVAFGVIPVVDDASIALSTYTVGAPLQVGTQYYWRVTAVNALGNTAATNNDFDFTTMPAPGAFNLLTPADAATDVLRIVTVR